jgi:hypothetical protein
MAPRHTTRLWVLMATDLMTAIWMYSFGPWLDETSRLTATTTLGGHHQIVLVIAAAGFVTLAVLALLTDGFTKTSRNLTLATNVACVLSVVALAGLIAFVIAALLSRLLFGRFRP